MTAMGSIRRTTTGRWQARCRDSSGKQHAKNFPRKVDADRWLPEISASQVTGTHVDPRAGNITFRDALRALAYLRGRPRLQPRAPRVNAAQPRLPLPR